MNPQAEISNEILLAIKAQELAKSQTVSYRPPAQIPLLNALPKIPKWLEQAKLLFNTRDVNTAKVAEWVYDNGYVVDRAITQIQIDMPTSYYQLLPSLQNTSGQSLPRAYYLASGLLAATGIQLSLNFLVKFVKGYQQETTLNISELWALPTLLRLVCIQLIVEAVDNIVPELTVPYSRDDISQPLMVSRDEIDYLSRAIHCLSVIETIPWRKFFEQVSVVEEKLRHEPADIYQSLDFDSRDRYCKVIENLARATAHDEAHIAERAVALACCESANGERYSHVGYWLVDEGLMALEKDLGYQVSWWQRFQRFCGKFSSVLYLLALAFSVILAEVVVVVYLYQNNAQALTYFAGLALTLIPASMLSIAIINWLITLLWPSRILNKLDFDQRIDPQYKTAVVIPSMLSSDSDIDTLLKQIELHYLSNNDPALRFVLLTDYLDAQVQSITSDADYLNRVSQGVRALNSKYGTSNTGPFHLLHRERRYNRSENCWMGWERKRGKLSDFNQFLSDKNCEAISVHEGEPLGLNDIRYVITLDSDTQLCRGAAAKLIGTLAHPLNRAIFDDKTSKVIAGYTIIQPRIEIAPTIHRHTWFTRLASGDRVIDIYSHAVSDVYQDLFSTGIFVGKGIYEVASFERSLKQCIPENTILSHDLFEGILGRVALASDIVLYENFPTHYFSFSRRLHRWIRGDWQLVPWLANSVFQADGTKVKNRFGVIERWKIIDNLRRSLFAPTLLLWIIAGWLWLPGNALVWTAMALLAPVGHNFCHFMLGVARAPNFKTLMHSFIVPREVAGRWLLLLIFLPYEAIIATDAIARTLYRMTVSRGKMLEWVTAADTDNQLNGDDTRLFYWREMSTSILLTLSLAAAVASVNLTVLPIAAPLLFLWLMAPEIARVLRRTLSSDKEKLSDDEVIFLRRLARRTWLFFETFVGPSDHWLPPDNYQEDPHGTVSHRTSPTNIGMMLLSNVSAWDFGYLGPTDLAARLLASMNTLTKLEHYRGHIFNWYDTKTLEVLSPRYISMVDSGNLAAALMTLEKSCQEVQNTAIFTCSRWDGLMDNIALIEESLALLNTDKHHDFTLLVTLIADIRHKANKAKKNSALWWLTIHELCQEDCVDFDRALVTTLAKKYLVSRVSQLRDVRVWLGRLHQHLRDMLRDIDRLLPWLSVLLQAQPKTLHQDTSSYYQAISSFNQVLKPTLSLAEVPFACESAQALIATLRDAKPSLWLEEPANDFTLWLNKLEIAVSESKKNAQTLQVELNTIATLASEEVSAMDFCLLYDQDAALFHIGWNATMGIMDTHHYDLLASEARLGSIVAIGKGDVSIKHWFTLGRSVTKVAGRSVLLSWGGTMFEYLMPRILLRSHAGTLLAQSEQVSVDEQIKLAEKRNTPWGISESGYAAVDFQHNYQYRAFGVPSLGYKRGLDEDTVISPYSTALALAIYPLRAVQNLQKLTKLGMMSLYGMYEAIDYTPERVAKNRRFSIVRSHMAHHQGMILTALDNAIFHDQVAQRFQSCPMVQTVELLLHEQIPTTHALEFPIDEITEAEINHVPMHQLPHLPTWKPKLHGVIPQLHTLSNGRFTTLLTDSGSGGILWRHNALTRWSADSTLDNQGLWIYIRDLDSGEIWSAGRQPVNKRADKYEVVFHAHMAEFNRHDKGISLRMEIAVAANDDVEVRRLSFINETAASRRLQVSTYAEVVLTPSDADQSHPAFSKLFVHSELASNMNALIFERRARSPQEKSPAMMHRLLSDSDAVTLVGYETDRAKFMGRNGSIQSPQAVTDGVSKTLGWTLDAVMSLQVNVELSPYHSESFAFITIAASSRHALFDVCQCYEVYSAIDLLFHDALFKVSNEMKTFDYAVAYLPELQQLLALIIYPVDLLRAADKVITDNLLGQSALWPFGISGDFPILLMRLVDETNVALLRLLFFAYRRWHHQGIKIDFVILQEGPSGYDDKFGAQIQQLIHELDIETLVAQRAGIHVIHSDQISDPQKHLLEASANVILGAHSSLKQQLALAYRQTELLPPFRGMVASEDVPQIPKLQRRKDLAFFNGLGGFTDNEYIIYLEANKSTPAPWCNVLANANFGSIVSEVGGGYTWAGNSGENRLTTWTNDPVIDQPSEAVYLRDEQTAQVWTVTPKPIGTGNPCEVTHSVGDSRWRSHWHQLEQELSVFVAHEDPIKVTRLRLNNTSPVARRLTVTYYAELVNGVSRAHSGSHIFTEYSANEGVILAKNRWSSDFSTNVSFLFSDYPVHAFTTDRAEFIGREGHCSKPAALARWGMSGKVGAAVDPCAALQVHIDLAPHEQVDIHFIFGQGKNDNHVQQLIKKWRSAGVINQDWTLMKAHWQKVCNAIKVETPSLSFNLMMNQWLIYQTLACRIFARSGFYQSSGAYGFRDQLQDVMALVSIEPTLARAYILECAAHQFDLGDVLHWWHPPYSRGVRTHCSDDLMWLPFVTSYYVETSGDSSILHEKVPFLLGEPLTTQEADRYSKYESSSESYSLFEHCQRAIERGTDSSGEHGLLLIGTGDWNDGMDRVGVRGRGESVWLCWFAIAVIDAFTVICDQQQRNDLSLQWRKRAKDLCRAVENNGWDGAWYRRAFDDMQLPWGSIECQECRIDSIAQSWATLCGKADKTRAKQALTSAKNELIDQEHKLARLLWPPFDATMRDPGYIKAYPPGTRENGGQYSHAATWLGWALAKDGDGDGAMQIFNMLNPIERSSTEQATTTYQIEPYVMAGDIATAGPHIGRGGWSWYTGSAAWAYRLGTEAILGIRYRDKYLLIDPCIPKSWGSYSARLTRENGTIELAVKDPEGAGCGVIQISVNGKVITGHQVALPSDNELLTVEVLLGKETN